MTKETRSREARLIVSISQRGRAPGWPGRWAADAGFRLRWESWVAGRLRIVLKVESVWGFSPSAAAPSSAHPLALALPHSIKEIKSFKINK